MVIASRHNLLPDLSLVSGATGVETGDRRRRTMIFGDFKGFSRLGDAQLPLYVEHVLGACASVLALHREHLIFRNTWGDGLFQVYDDVAVAAEAALDLCKALRELDLTAVGLPDTLGIRLGMHYGPVFERLDPVLERTNVFGFHVSKAARIEPITPEGEIYVTDAAAAALAVEARDSFQCDYVGRVPLAKGYGEFPMYALERRTG
jgi:class 3 adenylate cyclase